MTVLDKQVFKKCMKRLEAAFRTGPIGEDSIKIYYEKLREISSDDFVLAVETIIESESYFPSIATFLKIKVMNYVPEEYEPHFQDR